MQFVEPKFEIIHQGNGFDEMNMMVPKAGFTCYKTVREITPESAKRFINNMIEHKHGAMLEHATVYLKFHFAHDSKSGVVEATKYYANKFSRVVFISNDSYDNDYYITTNLRVIIENHWENDLRYISECTEYHTKRIAVRFWMDRVGTQSCERHRGKHGISFAQESTRYCNYSLDRNDGEIKICVPHWTSKEELDNTVNSDYYFNSIKEIHQRYLSEVLDDNHTDPIYDKIYYWIAANDFSEYCYMKLIECGMHAEDARGILPLDINSEMVMTAFYDDWIHFLRLRTDIAETGPAHPDITRIANKLRDEFIKEGLITEFDLKNLKY